MAVKPKAPYTIPPPTMAGTPKKIKIPNRLLISMLEFLSNCNCLILHPLIRANRASATTPEGVAASHFDHAYNVSAFINNCLKCKGKKR
jgi:hypothetical protein